MKIKKIKAGDFTSLASNYSQHRPDYSITVLKALCGLINKAPKEINYADIGAGTGIWTRMVHETGINSIIAIEPNKEMRSFGEIDSQGTSICWLDGSAEKTGLKSSSLDWVTMASSFHWSNFNQATLEFNRILKRGGWFTALWNPRLIKKSPLLTDIENHIYELDSNIKRYSSGLSGITKNLTENLYSTGFFDDVVYLEGRHKIMMEPDSYLGIWQSVNDVRVQLGEEKFSRFLAYVEKQIKKVQIIETTYITRAWSARRN